MSHASMADDRGLAQLRAALAPLADYPGGWWIAGGWAIDLACPSQVREHKDVDVVIRDDETDLLFDHLRDWQPVLEYPRTGERSTWQRGQRLTAGPDTIVIDSVPRLQLLVGKFEYDQWVYPRGTGRLRRTVEAMSRIGRWELPIQAAEVVLLFKSREHRPENDLDFDAVRSHLDDDQRSWLRSAIEPRIPDHPWLSALAT